MRRVDGGFQNYYEGTMKETGFKNSVRQVVLWAGLILILLLVALSIYGAFIGADNAKVFFNSPPLSIFWLVLGLIFIAGIVLFPRLHTSAGSFATHFGCLLVLAGGFWGSQAVINFRNDNLHAGLIRSGEMVIYEGQAQQEVITDYQQSKNLPFAVKLVDFKIEYYQQGRLLVQTPQGKRFGFPAITGKKYDLGPDSGSIEVVRQFNSFKIHLDNGSRIAIDDPNGQPNPALELKVIGPDGSETTRYAFEKFPGHQSADNLAFFYRRTISEYISDVEIIKAGSVVASKSIEVNKPLNFGGYLFYQQDYDHQAGQYTILSVVSNTGLFTVHLGFVLLCAGLFWNMWLNNLKLKTKHGAKRRARFGNSKPNFSTCNYGD
jgi:hypothetical protein